MLRNTKIVDQVFHSLGRFFMRLRRQPWDRIRPGEKSGVAGERIAAEYLRRKGYKIVQGGYRKRRGEIDIIATHRNQVCFIEVKTRVTAFAGEPFEAVDHRKQANLTRAALLFLKEKRLLEASARFDVISIKIADDQPAEIRHIENAFPATNLSGGRQMFS